MSPVLLSQSSEGLGGSPQRRRSRSPRSVEVAPEVITTGRQSGRGRRAGLRPGLQPRCCCR